MENRDRSIITIALTGDVMLGRLVNEAINLFGPYYPWGDTLPLLKGADLRLINLECVIAKDGRPWRRTPKVFHFRADPLAIEVLKVAGIDYVSLANNHSLDYEEGALLEMLERLDSAGIAHAGAGRTIQQAVQPAFLTAKGIKVGIISFTDNEPVWEAGATRPGTNYIAITTKGEYFDRTKRSVEAAHRGGADLVVFSIHWGPNMRLRPSRQFEEFAHAVMDLGVDIYHGHSAHIFQGIEVYKDKPIIYDAGDFIDDYAVDPILRNDQSLLFLLTATAAGVERIEMIPVLIGERQVNAATGADFDQIASGLQKLSAEMGTKVEKLKDRLVIELRRPNYTPSS